MKFWKVGHGGLVAYLTLMLSASHLGVYFVTDGNSLAVFVFDGVGHSEGTKWLMGGEYAGLGLMGLLDGMLVVEGEAVI